MGNSRFKFRAWDKKDRIMMRSHEHKVTFSGKLFSNNGLDVTDDYILMQYTGLKDKNGKEIYEGDIVKIKYYDALGTVEFRNGSFWIFEKTKPYVEENPQWSIQCAQYVEGNIYENPELIKEDE